jgi:hypothetical protein
MRFTLGEPAPTEIGDGDGLFLNPRWTPFGDRILVARRLPERGLDSFVLFSLDPSGDDPLLVFPDGRFDYKAFDATAWMNRQGAASPFEPIDIAQGRVDLVVGRWAGGNPYSMETRDGVSLALATDVFQGREVTGILLTLDLGAADPEAIEAIRVEVTAGLSRTDDDSFLRIALGNVPGDRFDTVVEISPQATGPRTYSFATSSLAHVDRDGRVRIEVIGDLSPSGQGQLLVDHIAVGVRLRSPPQ